MAHWQLMVWLTGSSRERVLGSISCDHWLSFLYSLFPRSPECSSLAVRDFVQILYCTLQKPGKEVTISPHCDNKSCVIVTVT